jgi:ABC-type transport system involved in multi-copper enzyme maturation permease subunit
MLGPIFSVEMITGSRRARQFFVRALYGSVLLFAFWAAYEETHQSGGRANLAQAANVASSFFQFFSVVQLLAVVLIGPALAASTVAVERERRTIEYLFATDLTNREIILGKMAAQLIQLSYVVLGGLPVLAFAMLMGGIAPEQLIAVLVITLSTLVTITVLAVAVSVWSPRARDAIMRVYLILFVVLMIPAVLLPMLLSGTGLSNWLVPLNEFLIQLNPFMASARSTWPSLAGGRGAGNVNWDPVWNLVMMHSIVTVILGALAVWAVRRVHLRESGKAPKQSIRPRMSRRQQLGNHPMLWKEMITAKSSNKLGIVGNLVLAAALLTLFATAGYCFINFDEETCARTVVITSDFLCCGTLLFIATRAAAAITSEKEKDTWVTLLSTPLTGREIIAAKVASSIYSGIWLLILLIVLWGLQIAKMKTFAGAMRMFGGMSLTVFTLLVIAFFVTSMGTSYSLKVRNSTRAIAATLATALFVGGGYLFCCMPIMIGSRSSDGEIVVLSACIPVIIATPGVLAVEGLHTHENKMIVPYVIGTLGYLAAATVIFATMMERFDDRNGRGT